MSAERGLASLPLPLCCPTRTVGKATTPSLKAARGRFSPGPAISHALTQVFAALLSLLGGKNAYALKLDFCG